MKAHTDFQGGCACGGLRYLIAMPPLFVHCCHCRWCQRETGSAFALNALVETDRITVLSGVPENINTPTNSGKGQDIVRCPSCKVALWSHYAGAGEKLAFVRVGTLDVPDLAPPDIHIFTESKQPWVLLPAGIAVMERYYNREKMWPPGSLERWAQL